MPDILHRLRIGATPAKVFDAIATEAGVRGWWTRDATLQAAVGGRGEFAFGCDGKRVVTRTRTQELERSSLIVWAVVESFRPEWRDTTIEFQLCADGTGTLLRFAQRGFAAPDDDYAQANTRWAYYLVSLRRYLETGVGAPSPDVDFFVMLAD